MKKRTSLSIQIIFFFLFTVLFTFLNLCLIFDVLQDSAYINDIIMFLVFWILFISLIIIIIWILNRFYASKKKSKTQVIGVINISSSYKSVDINGFVEKSATGYLIVVFTIGIIILLVIGIFGINFFDIYLFDMKITSKVLLYWSWINWWWIFLLLLISTLITIYVVRKKEK